MSEQLQKLIETDPQAKAFDLMRRGLPMPIHLTLYLIFRGLIIEPLIVILRYLPGPVGMLLRRWHAQWTFKGFGKNSLIDFGAVITGGKNIEISDYVWIDRHVELAVRGGSLSIGRRVHIAPYSLISALGGVVLEDYVGISGFVKIYSHSEAPRDGKRMSGPMVVEEHKGMVTAPVVLKKDCFIGTGAVILPGVTVGEGAVVAANALVRKDVAPWTIVSGIPAKEVGKRDPVTVPDDE